MSARAFDSVAWHPESAASVPQEGHLPAGCCSLTDDAR